MKINSILPILFILLILCFIQSQNCYSQADLIKDVDGNSYHTITISKQLWLVENLSSTHFNDGTEIPLTIENKLWKNLSTSGYCWYEGDSTSNKKTYGALYNWYAVNTGKLCPLGWKVPSFEEWTTLTEYLKNNGFGYTGSGDKTAKSMAAKSGWQLNWESGTIGNDQVSNNSCGFTALPGGMRWFSGRFESIGTIGWWWSSTETNKKSAWLWTLGKDYVRPGRDIIEKTFGYSVRCIKDK
jgi:uncharacterized protein (TIGR02145 family)